MDDKRIGEERVGEDGQAEGGPGGGEAHGAKQAKTPNQAERAVMHPDPGDPEWHYYHGAWHS